ncbi:hypothetical protein PanWU01x14_346420 [Parasponia andersonii]|uniref:Uncharacterized protein n=1 Tax=Parasponia andersonii TaxID=3476 RepID=A0A2P5ACD3_PARAD|nr:hypothetical protein PanWU01x14_346420 [Parasponia andersonii]
MSRISIFIRIICSGCRTRSNRLGWMMNLRVTNILLRMLSRRNLNQRWLSNCCCRSVHARGNFGLTQLGIPYGIVSCRWRSNHGRIGMCLGVARRDTSRSFTYIGLLH